MFTWTRYTMTWFWHNPLQFQTIRGGNSLYLQALAGLVEIPAITIAIYIISKVGKKWLFSATLISAGIACGCAAATEGRDDILWLKITFIMIGEHLTLL